MKNPTRKISFEKAVLGAMLIDEIAIEKALRLSKDDFYNTHHKIIFETIVETFCSGNPVDIVVVSDRLREKKKFVEVGGADYLTELINEVITTSNVDYYIDKIKDASVQRNAEINTHKFINGQISRQELLVSLEEIIKEKKEIVSVKNEVNETYDQIKKIMEGDKRAMGISTGYYDIDKIIGGLKPGGYITIAGRPSMGKTTFALNICKNVAQSENKPVLFISLETMAENLMMRLIYAQSKVSENKVLDGYAGKEDKAALEIGVGMLKKTKIHILDNADLTTTDMRVQARQFKRKHPDLALIVIDYLQRLKPARHYDSENREVSSFSNAINGMAKELKVPIIALSQLNRELEKRINKRPKMADLRSSGQVEQDSDIIMMLYRDVIYNPIKKDEEDKSRMKKLEVAIVKNRDGQLGVVNLLFFGDEKRIESELKPYF